MKIFLDKYDNGTYDASQPILIDESPHDIGFKYIATKSGKVESIKLLVSASSELSSNSRIHIYDTLLNQISVLYLYNALDDEEPPVEFVKFVDSGPDLLIKGELYYIFLEAPDGEFDEGIKIWGETVASGGNCVFRSAYGGEIIERPNMNVVFKLYGEADSMMPTKVEVVYS